MPTGLLSRAKLSRILKVCQSLLVDCTMNGYLKMIRLTETGRRWYKSDIVWDNLKDLRSPDEIVPDDPGDLPDDWMTVLEVADMLGRDRGTIRRMMARGDLPWYAIGDFKGILRRSEVENALGGKT